jgi:hypothetical protein
VADVVVLRQAAPSAAWRGCRRALACITSSPRLRPGVTPRQVLLRQAVVQQVVQRVAAVVPQVARHVRTV